MKLQILFICFFVFVFSFAQGQKIYLTGSNFSFKKGNIDVEVLSEIIQQKQEEVMHRVFQNYLIDNFSNIECNKKSIATYFFFYNLLLTLKEERNKTKFTREIINYLIEYSLVYGFTKEFIKMNQSKILNLTKSDSSININSFINKQFLANLDSINIKGDKNNLKELDDIYWKNFNIYMDITYDIFLHDTSSTSLHANGLFNNLQENPNLFTWYKKDNAYKCIGEIKSKDLDSIRNEMEKVYQKFKEGTIKSFIDIYTIYNELENTNFKQIKITENQIIAINKTIRSAIKTLKNYSSNNILSNILGLVLDYIILENKNQFDQDNSTKNSDSLKNHILYIDAEGLISELHSKYFNFKKQSSISKNFYYIRPRPFLIIGTAYGGAFNKNNQLIVKDGVSSNLNSIYFASEKIGLKFTFVDRIYTHSFQPGEEFSYHGYSTYWNYPQKERFIGRYVLYLYGSGLLYNIANIKTNENFNYTLVGASFGITFYNGLILNAGTALPINAKSKLSTKYLYTFSLDIPIIEYLSALRKKRNIE